MGSLKRSKSQIQLKKNIHKIKKRPEFSGDYSGDYSSAYPGDYSGDYFW